MLTSYPFPFLYLFGHRSGTSRYQKGRELIFVFSWGPAILIRFGFRVVAGLEKDLSVSLLVTDRRSGCVLCPKVDD